MIDSGIGVKEIWQEGERYLAILWTDERRSVFDVTKLREFCPCASCIDEITKERRIAKGTDFSKVRPRSIQSTGAYAMRIEFNDGHKTGIYTFDYLRSLDEARTNERH